MTVIPEPMDLLACGVPLSLLIDLVTDEGPHSAEILADEPGDADWLPAGLRHRIPVGHAAT